MAISSGKDPFWTAKRGIVQNGLVLNLDAAVSQSYPGTGTVWRDLSGRNNHGTLTNGPVYNRNNGGAIDFDGTNDYITGSFSAITSFPFTLAIWTKFQYKAMGGSPSLQIDLSIGANSSQYFGIGNAQFSNTSEPILFARNTSFTTTETAGLFSSIYSEKWNYVCGVFISDTQKDLYINKNYFISQTTNVPFVTPTSFTLGAGPAPSLYTRCQHAMAQVYNRALSASEIAQNFNVTRNRFGV